MKLIFALAVLLIGHITVLGQFVELEDDPQFIEQKRDVSSVKDQTSRVLLNFMLENLLDEEVEKLAVEALEEEALKKADSSNPEEVNELESMLEENDGPWLDEAASLENNLPANFQNLSEFTTKIGGKKIKIKDFVNKATSKDGKSTYLSELINAEPAKRGLEIECSLTIPCRDDQYCFETEYTSVCLTCQKLGTECLDDAQCCATETSNPVCVEGLCRDGVQPGSAGTICKSENDCLPGFCCANSHHFPRRLCRQYSQLNEQCSPIEQNADITTLTPVDYFCPCQGDLKCTARKPTSLHDYVSLKYNLGFFCAAERKKKDYIQPQEKIVARDSKAPVSDEDLLDMYNRLWQLRAESIDDQKYLNSPNSNLRHNIKESLEYK